MQGFQLQLQFDVDNNLINIRKTTNARFEPLTLTLRTRSTLPISSSWRFICICRCLCGQTLVLMAVHNTN